MKVICAGYGKTGTKTMVVALEQLGYNVHDYLDHFHYSCDEWTKIIDGKGSKEDFLKMYKDVDAVCDIPANIYWEEILEVFPGAKVILMVRDDEESWLKSAIKQDKVIKEATLALIPQYITPTGIRLFNYRYKTGEASFWHRSQSLFRDYSVKPAWMVRRYRMHNASVMQRCPKEQLLIYNTKQGWDPLCKFLNKPVPTKIFPHKNIGGSVVNEVVKTHPVFRQIKIEMAILMILLIAVAAFGISFYWQ